MNHSDGLSSTLYVTSYDRNESSDSAMMVFGSSSSSTSSVSFWSDASSQSSDDSSVTSDSSTLPSTPSPCTVTRLESLHQETRPTYAHGLSKSVTKFGFSPPECERSKRRSLDREVRHGLPAKIVRQGHRNFKFVDSLVDSSAQIVEAIWPSSPAPSQIGVATKEVLPLRTFIQETLRRSRTSYSTLQVTLYYLILIKPHVLRQRQQLSMVSNGNSHKKWSLLCGRRMFLTALILASKYLQDRNYSARAWSKISGLNVLEINHNEIIFLLAVRWQLHVTETIFQRWTDIVLKYTSISPPSDGLTSLFCGEISPNWKAIVLGLTPQLDNIADVVGQSKRLTINSSLDASHMHMVMDTTSEAYDSKETLLATSHLSPNYLEPSPSAYPTSRRAPALGLLPTPRLTPQISVFNTPAINSANQMNFMAANEFSETKLRMNAAPATLKRKNLNPKMSSISLDPCHYPSILTPSFMVSSPEPTKSEVLSQLLQSSSSAPKSSQIFDFRQTNMIQNNETHLNYDEILVGKGKEYESYPSNDPFPQKSTLKGKAVSRQSSKGHSKEKFCTKNNREPSKFPPKPHYHSGLDVPCLWTDESCKNSPKVSTYRSRNICAPLGDSFQRTLRKRSGVDIDLSPSIRASNCINSVSSEGNVYNNKNPRSFSSKYLLSSSGIGSTSTSSDQFGINIWASNHTPPQKRICYTLGACQDLPHFNSHPNLYDGLSIFPRWSGL